MATESVSVQMENLLNEFSREVQDVTDEAIKDTAKEAVQKLQNSSPKLTGDYGKGWAVKADGKLCRIVYNKTDWQLTHLLENGHVIKNQFGSYGRVSAKVHIAPVEEWAQSELPVRISRGLS